MKTTFAAGVGLAALFTAAALQAAPPAAAGDEAQLRALETRYAKAFSAEDVSGVMSVYSRAGDLFVFDAVPPRQYVGWEAYRKDFQALFAQFPGHAPTTLGELHLTVVGPVAYGHSVQTSDFTAKDGSKVRLIVRVTDVYRKQSGGWKIVQEHVSFPVNLPSGQADLLSKP
ncbi:MAG TPA: nuclear transport factor 2 family protein [Caulobacteraceae bacterium]|nr:nuclear transport factor 2 family protein [Caulobacteraceae bacterium]